jgi:hypothetical protein
MNERLTKVKKSSLIRSRDFKFLDFLTKSKFERFITLSILFLTRDASCPKTRTQKNKNSDWKNPFSFQHRSKKSRPNSTQSEKKSHSHSTQSSKPGPHSKKQQSRPYLNFRRESSLVRLTSAVWNQVRALLYVLNINLLRIWFFFS